jgi:hypothetical protein
VYSGTEYSAIGWDGSGRQVFGDDTPATTITGSSIRLPNNVPLYGIDTGGDPVGLVKCDSSDQVVLGDGSLPIYFDSTSLVMPAGTKFEFHHASQLSAIEHDSANNRLILGDTSFDEIYFNNPILIENNVKLTWEDSGGTARGVLGVASNDDVLIGDALLGDIVMNGAVKFPGTNSIFDGVGSKAGLPTTSDISSGHWAFYYNTTDSTMGCFFNVSGTIVRVS